jgi:hypothetical protein
LTHQQGPSGGPALLTAPAETPAWQAMRQYYDSDGRAMQAISANIPGTELLSSVPVEQITAGEFRNMWIDRFGTSAVLG